MNPRVLTMFKKAFFLGIAILSMSFAFTAQAKDVYVKGYTRSDGTQVRGHYRSGPDNSFDNNWSTEGNTNPYTGEKGTLERRGY